MPVRHLPVLVWLSLAFLVTGCGDRMAGEQSKLPRVALLLSVGGLGDKSFNDSAHEGLMRAQKELAVKVFEGQPSMFAEDARYLRTYAARGFDLIIAVGFLMKPSVVEVARDYPKIHFALIDAAIDQSENPHGNIATLRFKEHEGSFLVGAAAALASKSGKIGFVGGMEIPLIHKFQQGYEEGAKAVNPNVTIFVKYAGSGPEAFTDPVKGKQLAEGMISLGADVLFHASGSTGNGMIEACRQQGKLGIGVDANQDQQAPGYVLTSMIKRVDIAVFSVIQEVLEKRFKGVPHEYGLKEGAVSTTDFACMRDPKLRGDRMTTETMNTILKRLDQFKADIIAGKIKVSDYEAQP
jgi:basic membrane protein A